MYLIQLKPKLTKCTALYIYAQQIPWEQGVPYMITAASTCFVHCVRLSLLPKAIYTH